MRACRFHAAVLLLLSSSLACASQADDTSITIKATTAGPTVFIAQLTLQASDTSVVSSIQFTIAPKPGSVTRALSGSYSQSYLTSHGYITNGGQIFLPLYGLYSDFANSVTLTYNFLDGSWKQATTILTTGVYTDLCSLDEPVVLQPRSTDASLSYDYMFLRGSCENSPVIIDSDAAIRWVSPLPTSAQSIASSGFFDNAVYVTDGTNLYREDLDGTVTLISDYSGLGVLNFHHTIDRGKAGIILEADTVDYTASVNYEVDAAGNVLRTWKVGDIISAAMIAGGDDPSQFVYPAPNDWFHNNAATYKRSDDTLILSSRENFVIGLDYETGAIKWILGDETKHWFEFPSLAQFSLTLGTNTLPPIGQHAVSITVDNNLFLMDNGQFSGFQMPPGIDRGYSIPRKYRIDSPAQIATELKDYPGTEDISSEFCGSAYEDAKSNYLVDYAYILPVDGASSAELLGYDATGAKVFDYMYPSGVCDTAFGAFPLHLESTKFPAVGPQSLNISTRAMVGEDDNALIEGFIITGTIPKTLVLRAIGPSLGDAGVDGPLADPILNVYDSAGALIATNDNWQDDPEAAAITAARLAPTDPLEAATLQTLSPGAYTVVVRGQGATTGVALVEAYDLSPQPASILANISARGMVGTGEDVIISGFIVGDVGSTTTVIRAIGPSLSSVLDGALSDPTLTIFDSNGSEIASNDNWQDDPNSADLQLNGFAPADPAESAVLLNLPAGAYTGIVEGAGGGTGIGLVEVYDLK